MGAPDSVGGSSPHFALLADICMVALSALAGAGVGSSFEQLAITPNIRNAESVRSVIRFKWCIGWLSSNRQERGRIITAKQMLGEKNYMSWLDAACFIALPQHLHPMLAIFQSRYNLAMKPEYLRFSEFDQLPTDRERLRV